MAKSTINYALEQTIANYLTTASFTSGSLLSGSQYTCYTALNNQDIAQLPGVVIDAYSASEMDYNTRNYDVLTKIEVYEIAADTQGSSAGGNGQYPLGRLAGLIFNEFENSISASQNIPRPTVYGVNFWQVEIMPMTHETSGDSLVSTFELSIKGAMVPPT